MANHIQPGVYIEQRSIPISRPEMATAVPVFIGYTETGGKHCLYKINAFSDYVKLDSGKLWTEKKGYLYAAIQHYFEVGGDHCFVLSVDKRDLGNWNIETIELVEKLEAAALSSALSEESSITLMSMPDLALLDEAGTPAQWATVYKAMLDTCKKHNWFAVLDSPNEIEDAKLLLTQGNFGIYAEYGAAYWPHLKVNSSGASSNIFHAIPPSSAVAAMIQRVDRERGIWKAPANEALPQVIAPEHDHWDAQNVFNPQGKSINVIRSFAKRGVRVWGCRTLAGSTPSQRQYIQTRRLLTYIESNLTKIARFAAFEPNNEITWIKLKGLAKAWLRQLWFKGGLFGATEDEAFRVSVGLHETMTHADIQAGKLIMRVSTAPLYRAEFIDITLQFYTNESNVAKSASYALQQDIRTPA